MNQLRGVAQPGSAHGSGPWSRRFKSSHPDFVLWAKTEYINHLNYLFDISVEVLYYMVYLKICYSRFKS